MIIFPQSTMTPKCLCGDNGSLLLVMATMQWWWWW